MSIVDEVMSEEAPTPNTTVFVNGVQTFVPRTAVKTVLGNLTVGLTTTRDPTQTHYIVGDGVAVYHMFHAQAGLNLVDVLAMAYRNVFMWIRPQGANEIYYDPAPNRDAALAHLTSVLFDLVGSGATEKMYADYRDERVLEINPREEPLMYDISRTYDRKTDRITTTIMELPGRCINLSFDELFEEGLTTILQKTPAFVDPGDFIPGAWTPDPDAEVDGVLADEFHPDNTPA